MSTLTASNLDERPSKINHPPSSSSLFLSLPNDIVLNILSRLSKRYDYPILSCVSKKFQFIVRSREIQETRSHLGKDPLYISFCHEHPNQHDWLIWFTLGMKTEKNPTDKNLLVSTNVSFLNKTNYSFAVAVGLEIFFIGGFNGVHSSRLFIFDTKSGEYREGPNMQKELRCIITVGLVGSKIYVIGLGKYKDELRADFFDLKTQTWKLASILKGKGPSEWPSRENNITLDMKVCWLTNGSHISCYNTRDNSWESFEFANEEWCMKGMCVIDNVFYVYYDDLGLMWYDSKVRQWRRVSGLGHLNLIRPVGMAEYYGKLAFMWTKPDRFVVGEDKKQVWCRMISLDRNEVGIHGTAEPPQLLGTVPPRYSFRQCLSLST